VFSVKLKRKTISILIIIWYSCKRNIKQI